MRARATKKTEMPSTYHEASVAYRSAISFLREQTHSPSDAPLISLLIRAAILSPAVAELLCKADLKTRLQRRDAAIAAAVAFAADLDSRD